MGSPDTTPSLGNKAPDYIASSLRAAIGSCTFVAPFIAPMMAEVIGHLIPNQRVDRLERFMKALDTRLANLGHPLPDDRWSEPVAIDLMEDAFWQSARATSQERIEYIATLLTNSLSAEELQHERSKRLMGLLGLMSDAELIVLLSSLNSHTYQRDPGLYDCHKDILDPITRSEGDDDAYLDATAIRQARHSSLERLGLLKETTSLAADTVTRLGFMLLVEVGLATPEEY